MPEKSERIRRKAMLQDLASKRRAEIERQMPLNIAQLHGLLNTLDQALANGCDHSLRHTQAYLQSHNLPSQEVVPWLNEHGGFCDCEVLANIEEEWGEM